MKDFKDSYEQLVWQNACKNYQSWLPFLNSKYEWARQRAQTNIDRLVAEWPQLVDDK